MNQIFNPENFFWKCFDKMADVVGLSLLWFMCSLPVVTIGPACAALRPLRPGRGGLPLRPVPAHLPPGVQERRAVLPHLGDGAAAALFRA